MPSGRVISTNAAATNPRIDLLLQRAATPFTSKSLENVTNECDVIATFIRNGAQQTLLYDPKLRTFTDGRTQTTIQALRTFAETAGQEITFTAATPGSGPRYLPERIPHRR